MQPLSSQIECISWQTAGVLSHCLPCRMFRGKADWISSSRSFRSYHRYNSITQHMAIAKERQDTHTHTLPHLSFCPSLFSFHMEQRGTSEEEEREIERERWRERDGDRERERDRKSTRLNSSHT